MLQPALTEKDVKQAFKYLQKFFKDHGVHIELRNWNILISTYDGKSDLRFVRRFQFNSNDLTVKWELYEHSLKSEQHSGGSFNLEDYKRIRNGGVSAYRRVIDAGVGTSEIILQEWWTSRSYSDVEFI